MTTAGAGACLGVSRSCAGKAMGFRTATTGMTEGESARLEDRGNRTGVALSLDTSAAAGFHAGDPVRAEPAKVASSRHAERRLEFEAWWRRFAQRYRHTLHNLAW